MINKKRNKGIKATLTKDDCHIIFRTARAYKNVGSDIAFKYAQHAVNENLEDFDNDLLPVAATNLLLAIELYFKSLLLITSDEYSSGHNLLLLYEKLSEPIKLEMNQIYKSNLQSVNKKLPVIRRQIIEDIDVKNDPFKNDDEINTVLRIHFEGFTDWRYFFDVQINRSIYADFSNLIVLAQTLELMNSSRISS